MEIELETKFWFKNGKIDSEPRYFHLSVIINKNHDILSWGINNTSKKPNKYTHSENIAIQELHKRRKMHPKLFRRKDLTMINFAFTFKSGKLRMSKPCLHCEKLLRKTSYIRNVWYSTMENTFELN